MGLIKRESFYSSIASYTGVVIGYINVVLLFPYYFKPEQFGLTRVLLALAYILAQFANLGAFNVILKFFPFYKSNRNQHSSFLIISFLVPLLGFIAVSAIVYVFRDFILTAYQKDSELINDHFFLVFPLTFFILYMRLLESVSNTYFKTIFPIVIREVIIRLLTLIAIILYHIDILTFNEFLIVFIGIYGAAVVFLIIYLIRIGALKIKIVWEGFPESSYREMANYGFYALLGGAAVTVVANIDVVMVSFMVNLKDTAIYSVAFLIATVIQLPQRSISQIAIPVLSEAWKNNDLKKIEEIYRKSSINLILIGNLLFALVWINVDSLFTYLPEIYSGGKIVVLFILVSKLFDMYTGVNGEIIRLSRYYRFDLVSMVVLVLLVIGTNYIFIPIYGIAGAAFATALSVMIYNLVKLLFIWVKYKMQPFSLDSLKAFAAFGFSIGFGIMIPEIESHLADIFMRSLISAGLYLIIVVYFNLSPDLMHLLVKLKIKK
ncbi:MAG: capsular polysaccharide biosynthesis protein [Chitinophagales bacterium]|nr:MAG: capsular polysaccharide biosynthesis protein [Chitinophagales bacterium]